MANIHGCNIGLGGFLIRDSAAHACELISIASDACSQTNGITESAHALVEVFYLGVKLLDCCGAKKLTHDDSPKKMKQIGFCLRFFGYPFGPYLRNVAGKS